MKCPHCGMEVEPGEKKCPYCYGILECGDPDHCDDELAEHASRGKNKLRAVILVAAILLAAVCAAYLLFRMMAPSETSPDATVATYDGATLSNRDLNYYYWNDYYYFANYGVFDPDTPLEDQQYDSNTTWHDFMVESAIDSWRSMVDVTRAAKEASFELPEEYQEALATLEDDLTDSAEYNDFTDIDDYLKWCYGEAADLETFRPFVEQTYLSTAYSNAKYDELFDRFAYETDPIPTVAVRHILFGSDEYDDPEQSARDALDEFRAGGGTEDVFAELAGEYSTDPGSSSNGGLYDDVYEGQMVPAFDEWCFDPARQPGDTGLVETDYGWHVMYYVGEGEPTTDWITEDADDQYSMWLEELKNGEPKVTYSAIQIYDLVESELSEAE